MPNISKNRKIITGEHHETHHNNVNVRRLDDHHRRPVHILINGRSQGVMNTIAEQWGIFENMVVPVDAPLIQRREMRLAFYAGCQTMLNFNYLIGGESISEDAGVAMIENWVDECQRFFKQTENGEA